MAAPDGPAEHREFEGMAVAHVMGGLDQHQGRAFRAHLLECGECRARVGELRAIAHELAGVERDERRVRAAKAIETKDREDADTDLELPDEARRWRRNRILGFLGVAALVILATYTFTLRTSYLELEQRYDQRLDASAALEHGSDLLVDYTAPGVEVTARRSGDHVVLLMEGLRDDRVYGLYLQKGADGEPVTVSREPRRPEAGSVFVLARLQGDEDQLLVTELEGSTTGEPGSETTVFQAELPPDG
jgi:hypothetical protein